MISRCIKHISVIINRDRCICIDHFFTLGLAGWVLKKGVGAGKGIAKKIRSKKSDNGESGDGGSADGEDRYTESPAPSDGSDGAASGDAASAEENTDTGGSE